MLMILDFSCQRFNVEDVHEHWFVGTATAEGIYAAAIVGKDKIYNYYNHINHTISVPSVIIPVDAFNTSYNYKIYFL